MKCPICQNKSSRVIDSRPVDDNTAIRRRRECEKCGHRFTTFERMEMNIVFVKKHSGEQEPFSREKMMTGILRATSKRNLPKKDIEKIADNVEATVINRDGHDVTSEEIGELVMRELKKVDEVAYLRFASVYRRFDNIEAFIEELHHLDEGDSDE